MRTNATDVKAILGSTLADATVESYITGANLTVTNLLTGKGLDDDTLEEIERWIAAHLIAVTRERTSKKEGAGGAFIEYTGEWGAGLSSTSYGQMSMMLDTTGTLKEFDKGKKSISIQAL